MTIQYLYLFYTYMLLVTCPFGLTSLLTTELKRLHIQPQDSFPNGCWVANDSRETIIRINLHSRIANKVFISIDQGIVTSFEELFSLVVHNDRHKHIHTGQAFRVLATSMQSMLHAERTIQSICHKAIITQLTGSRDTQWINDDIHPQLDIYVYINNNTATIFKNTSGDSLHKRGRRQDQGEAPIKENLAVATLLLASWPFSQILRDPCCGSGTLIIEAARLAKNIAAGRDRTFAFQSFPDYPTGLFTTIYTKAREQELHNKSRTIVGSDINQHMLSIAQKNAEAAGVADTVQFHEHDMLDGLPTWIPGTSTIIANPPYGQRLDTFATKAIHKQLATWILQPERHGAVISGWEDALDILPLKERKRKETRQGKEICHIRSPKG